VPEESVSLSGKEVLLLLHPNSVPGTSKKTRLNAPAFCEKNSNGRKPTKFVL